MRSGATRRPALLPCPSTSLKPEAATTAWVADVRGAAAAWSSTGKTRGEARRTRGSGESKAAGAGRNLDELLKHGHHGRRMPRRVAGREKERIGKVSAIAVKTK